MTRRTSTVISFSLSARWMYPNGGVTFCVEATYTGLSGMGGSRRRDTGVVHRVQTSNQYPSYLRKRTEDEVPDNLYVETLSASTGTVLGVW